MAATPNPQDAPRFDPWSGNRAGGLRFFAVSTAIHAGLLFLFAGLSITVVHELKKIDVKVIDAPEDAAPEFEGAPSLQDLTGLLDVQYAPRQAAARPAGPIVRNVRMPEMPKIGGVGPKLGTGPEVDLGAIPLSFGAGGIGGLGGSFGDYVGGLRKTGLDLVLVIDTTESMQFVIDEVKASMTALVSSIQKMVPTSRVGIVVYRDRGDEYVVKWADLSFKTAKLREFLKNITAAGGGDWEEAVEEGLDAAMNELSWRKKSRRVIVLVGGSPPHKEDIHAIHAMVAKFREQGGAVSAIDVTEHLHAAFEKVMWKSLHGSEPFQPSPLPEFYKEVSAAYAQLASHGGGELVHLRDEKKLIRDILELTFGSRWKVEMAKYLKELS